MIVNHVKQQENAMDTTWLHLGVFYLMILEYSI
jgi:hypothetical protein